MEIVWGDRRFVLFKVLICVIAKLYNVHTLSTALHTEHDQQASRQSCVFHTKFQISYFFSCLWEKHWVFFNINSILVYTTFTCNLLCFFSPLCCSIATGNSFFVLGFLESICPLAVKMIFPRCCCYFFIHHFHHEQNAQGEKQSVETLSHLLSVEHCD